MNNHSSGCRYFHDEVTDKSFYVNPNNNDCRDLCIAAGHAGGACTEVNPETDQKCTCES